MDESEEREVFAFVHRSNIRRFSELLAKSGDENQRQRLRQLLADEQASLRACAGQRRGSGD